MNDESLRGLFSDVFSFSKNQYFYINEEKLEEFRQVLHIDDPTELNELIDPSNSMSFFKNIFSEYLWSSPAFSAYMGFQTPEEIIGQTDLSLPWSFEMAMASQESDEVILLSGLPSFKKEIWSVLSGGSAQEQDRIFNIRRYPVFNRKGEILGVLGVLKEDLIAGQFLNSSKNIQPFYELV
jgi:hypothetical protein